MKTTAALVVSAAASVVVWLAWLGWHAERWTEPGTMDTAGPYQPYQVVGLGLTLVVLVFAAAWWWPPAAVVTGAVLGLCAIAFADWGSEPGSDGLFVIGVAMIAVGATAVGSLVGLTAHLTSRWHAMRH
ncbi:MAG TPA: hypothetical protein VMF51_20955 [Nocardioides sp.]|uniref:hypothetical protein n=1 Tax=Nocardioides sp. TaxID=35761 RepID=UPI002C0878AC|nr:hypothetical protein [Nocardioides sp.]HTW17611.1 hypothetical protein [Nocardioides sp.]